MNVVVEDLLINYTVNGSGPVVILIHGWGDSLNTFRPIAEELQKKYKVYALDLPGFGGSQTPQSAYNLDKFVGIVSGFLSKLGIKKVYTYIGHSNGGAIAMKGLSSGVLVSEKLVLIASSGVRTSYTGRQKALRLAVKTAKVPTKLLPKITQKKIRAKVYSAIGSDMLVAENMQETFKNVVTEDLVTDSAMIPSDTLLIYGREDTATPIEYGKLFSKQIENSKLVVIEGADHFVHQTKSAEVVKQISSFLGNK